MAVPPSGLGAQITARVRTIASLYEEIKKLRQQKENVPNSLRLAQAKLNEMRAIKKLNDNPALARLVALREKVAKLEAELGESADGDN